MPARPIRFEVRYPWGIRYCGKLRAALRRLEFATGSDPLVEGSDNDGFLVAADRRGLATGRAMLRKMTDVNQTDALLGRMRAVGVYEVFQDWKHLDWEPDAATLKKLGVQLRLISELDANEGERLTFEIGRTARSARLKRRRRKGTQ
jgi:hypothetical protein